MNRFVDKVVLITGAGSGLGRAAAARVASEGAKVSLVDRDAASLADTRELIEKENPGVETLVVTADVADEAQVEHYVAATLEAFGKIDGFFNNAGVEGRQNLTEDYASAEFEKVIGINLTGAFYGLQHVLRVMRLQGHGAIVNTASVGGIRGIGNQSGYSASKHGLVGLTRNSGVEYGQYGIQVNAIAPGAIMTPMVEGSLRQIDPDNWEEIGQQFVQPNPMRRFGEAEEVAALVAFLLSGEAGFINAAVVPIDGGQSYKY
ncbi:SDR family oxidoreductase [Nocardioides marmoribigeumensis]|uniref:NAD(P)-dependent dehydrogenase (Short-subunit alcohol dehydrogenase family) n=1 Tax=Nocardioides marmoribigeumensis TaxID=433649 RepID=A0ABU2BXY2_9ACTN|nr:SDR family oxidoreductase [Nocardioides marmoribigeumensis]MDR7363251.1 NAD(P)-dependent dehydrogenase (short-subunit alcohol dehydrogenase family) [Nocardioides marmoribigeumensis]